ncbi:hypothetical protein C8J56DRAFT_91842 [Mycena floridula]|nr:hypothetical protein C8J56DRAFT_91842 [Mycena floridula]
MEFQPSLEPFPDLPTELVLLIVEFIVEIQPSKAVELLVLSRDIKPIVEQAMYRSVILMDETSIQLFAQSIESGCRPITFYQQNVHSICFAAEICLKQLLTILPACSKLQSLAEMGCIDELNQSSYTQLVSCGSSPARLSCVISWGFDKGTDMRNHRFTQPLFQLVTHLELLDSRHILDQPEFDGTVLHCLHHLTHICLIRWDFSARYDTSLASRLALADTLVVCIISIAAGRLAGVDSASIDPRIVFDAPATSGETTIHPHILSRNIYSTSHFIKQWGTGWSRGELDMWDEAEAIVALQRASRRSVMESIQ